MNQVVKQIRSLIEYLNANTRLYDEGNPAISDKLWDEKYFELKELENKYSIYFNDSPTQSISYEVVNSLEKVAHNHDMLSLEKTKSLDVIKGFLGNAPCVAMCKMDGLTCSLKYENGELTAAETRGNGKVGENILHNAKVIPSIPKHIPYTNTLVIDGEIICSKTDFESFKDEYKNPRNFASGSIRLLDSNECAKRKLQFIAWEVIEGLENKKYLSEKLNEISNYGFNIGAVVYTEESSELYVENVSEMLADFARDEGYPIDGIVFKFDDVEYGRSLGQTSHHFKNAMAYKFYDETYETRLFDIEWTMGRTGALTPVAVFEPIEIDGSIVERASLHNLSILKDTLHGFGWQGQKVQVSKRNMIIPQIEEAEEDDNITRKEYFTVPTKCPICGKETYLKQDNDSIFVVCNNIDCEGQLINRLDHFCGKKGLDIKGLSKATLEKLINWEWVSNYTDLFELDKYRIEWIKKPGFGEKSVDKILDAIKSSRECELAAFIAALGIPLIGTTASKELVKVFADWETFITAVETGYHFWDIPNFGFEMHSAITGFDYTEAKELYSKYLTVSAVEAPQTGENNLEGMNFVITGKLSHFKNRDELKAAIEAHGGKVVSSISSKTNYLINNDVNSTSSKNVSAKKLGVPIIGEDAFIETFGLF